VGLDRSVWLDHRLTWPELFAAIAVAAVLACAGIVAWPAPAHGHGSIGLMVSGDGRGVVRVSAQWADGHPVTGVIGASFTAVSDGGQRVGPVGLKMVGTTDGTMRYDGTLPPGQWAVVVDVGQPAIARCAGNLAVGSASPAVVTCPAAPATGGDQVLGSRTGSGTGTWPWLVAGTGVLAAGGLFLIAQRRTRADADAVRRGRPAR
jgi:hypothetical protein